MSAKPNIKWRKGDAERLTKEIERFNAKIYRARKSHPEIADILPTTIKKADKMKLVNDLKSSTRSEFNKTLKSYERFSKKGAEKVIVSKTGNKVTAWEKKEVGLKVAQYNRSQTIERKKVEQMEATSRGQSLGMKRGEMGSERMNELKPKTFNFDKIKGGKEWEKYKESINKLTSAKAKQERMEAYKQNYIKGMRNAYGEYGEDIIAILEKLPAQTIIDTYYSEQEATIEFHYEPIEMQNKLDILDALWQSVSDNYDDEIDG